MYNNSIIYYKYQNLFRTLRILVWSHRIGFKLMAFKRNILTSFRTWFDGLILSILTFLKHFAALWNICPALCIFVLRWGNLTLKARLYTSKVHIKWKCCYFPPLTHNALSPSICQVSGGAVTSPAVSGDERVL